MLDFLKQKKTKASDDDEFDAAAPEKLGYTKYYEHDGALRAYANRAMVLACAMTVLALCSLGFAIYVRLQPPTIVRINPDGESDVVSGRPLFKKAVPDVLADLKSSPTPQPYEREAVVRQFLDHYLNYDMHNVGLQWATALNMMTASLKNSALRVMRDGDVIGKIEEDNTRSVFHLRLIEASKDNPMAYTAYGVREIHRVGDNRQETVEQTVDEYTIRLADQDRSADNPSGLLIGDFGERQIDGEKRASLLAADAQGWKAYAQEQEQAQ
jgi:hypothetical protein